MNSKNNRARDIGFYALIGVILLATVATLLSQTETKSLKYSEIIGIFESENVKRFDIKADELILELITPIDGEETLRYKLYSVDMFYNDVHDKYMELYRDGTLTEFDFDIGFVPPWWLSFLPYFGVLIILGILWYVMMSRAAGGGAEKGAMRFGKARARLGSDEKKKVTFEDVAGADEEKAELQEIVGFLKNPRAFTEMGARIPKGVLLVGPPGTGKTLLAKAVAGEAGVHFLSISGSDFVELYVGVGASRVRDIFEQAKKMAPAIIFIDEIDAVGRKRGAGMGGGHDEREQTLNQLLVEMDGFGNNEGVIVMAATNRHDILDNALLRPGRFDRQVYVGLPDIRGREAILNVHAKGKHLADDISLNSIARGTPGFTGADLENLLNEAALLAVRRNKRFISMSEMDEAILKVMAGPEKKSRVISDKERRLTAYHEAGHAVVSKYLKHVDPVHHITIIPRGGTGGMTVFRPQEDKSFQSRSEMHETIISLLGGRIAERLFLDDISTGASNDIQRASSIARAMIMQYGMSDALGPISFDSSNNSVFIGRDFSQTKSYSEKIASEIDDEVKHIFDQASARCEEILLAHKDLIEKTAAYLLENEVMDGEDFNYLADHGVLPAREQNDKEGASRVKSYFGTVNNSTQVGDVDAVEPVEHDASRSENASESHSDDPENDSHK